MVEGNPTKWGKARTADIMKEARKRYGDGWDLLSEDQQKNYIHHRVLMILLGQARDEYRPAIELVSDIFKGLNP